MSKKRCYCDELRSVLSLYNRYFSNELRFTSTSRKRTENGKHYHFIPSCSTIPILGCLEELFDYFHKPFKHDSPKFLDCGCGIGNIVALANAVGFYACGIEYDTKTYKVACKLQGLNRDNIIKGDIIKFEKYSQFDVIYFYLPISSDIKMNVFRKKLMDDMRVGAILVSYNGCTEALYDERFKKFKVKNTVGLIRQKIKE